MIFSCPSASRRTLLFTAGLCLGLWTTQIVHAATPTWGNTSTDFNANGSWLGGAAPGTADTAIFDGAASSNQPNLTASGTITAINFTATGSNYLLSGNPGTSLKLTSASAITTNGSGTNTISANLVLTAATTTFSQQPGGRLVLSGNISEGATPVTLNLTRTAAGTAFFTLSGNNSYSGGTTINGANTTVAIGSATAFGTGAVSTVTSIVGMDNTSGASLTLANRFNFQNASFTYIGAANSMTVSGSAVLTSGLKTITVSGNTLTLSGTVSETGGAASIAKNGAGTLELKGPGTFTGTTSVSAGTLLLNNTAGSATGTGGVFLTSGTLGGTGSAAGAVSVGNGVGSADSILAAGATAASGVVGKFTASSSLTLASDSKVVMDILSAGTRGTNYDAIDVGTNLTFGGNLTLNITTGIGAGTYDLFAVTGTATQGLVSMAFSGGQYVSTWAETSPTSGIWTSTSGLTSFTFDEATGDLVVAVPEPSPVILLGAGIVLVLHKIRRRALRA